MQSIDSTEIYAYETSKDVWLRLKKHNPNWPEFPDHP